MSILIGGAWPYANGSLHIGHVAGLIPGDVLARYFRLKNEDVLYVSGSDCHGTPISIRAKQENKTPEEIADFYHKEFKECFEKLGFTYDLYTKTNTEFHKSEVQRIFLRLLENGYIYKKEIDQTYCEKCNQFLPDRYIEGICPNCGSKASGDQCDSCCTIFNAIDLKSKVCKICGSEPTIRKTEHFYFSLSKFQDEISKYLDDKKDNWRENAVKLTERYLNEGLEDRAGTRDLDYGIATPIEGYEGKKIYVWIEAVCGYLTASKRWAEETGGHWEKFWKGDDVTAYYVHGKDNIPFHTIILPALLLGAKEDLHLPDRIISSEFLNLEGKKISTSKNWAVWLPYIIEKYNPDSIRYFLVSNGPEKRDADFSWREFIHNHNSELLGCFGNFVNRNIPFIEKYDKKISNTEMDEGIKNRLVALYDEVGAKIEQGEFKTAIKDIFDFVREANKYFDETKPWILIKEDLEKCKPIVYTCFQIIINLSTLLEPFIPFSCSKIREFLGLPKPEWKFIEVKDVQLVGEVGILFDRIDKKVIEEETKALGS